MLSCSCLLPDGWVNVPLPEDAYALDNPAVMLPLLVCMAPDGAVVFTIAARPAFDDGTVQDWAEFLAAQSNLRVERIQEARVSRMPCILVDATMPSEAGPMRSRSVFLEDGRRLFNVGTLAPEAIWPSVRSDLDRLLGAFALDEVHGITAAPLRLMTSEPAVDLSAAVEIVSDDAAAPADRSTQATEAPAENDTQSPDLAELPDPEDETDARPRDTGIDPEFAGQPEWWRAAVMHERGDRLDEAEQAILQAVDHIGAYSSLASLYEERCARLVRDEHRDEHRDAAAEAARARAIHWLRVYASSATSGGEGAALSRERDQRIAALGGEESVAGGTD
jgi:hypothetical protein